MSEGIRDFFSDDPDEKPVVKRKRKPAPKPARVLKPGPKPVPVSPPELEFEPVQEPEPEPAPVPEPAPPPELELEQEPTPGPTPTRHDMRRLRRVKTVNHDQEVTWVYLNIDNPKCLPRYAPSLGAWTMLMHARANKGWFYDKQYKPSAERIARAKQAEEAHEYVPSKVEKLAVKEIEEMLQEALAASEL